MKTCVICLSQIVAPYGKTGKVCSLKCSYKMRGNAKSKDITGLRSGLLVAVRKTDQRKAGHIIWECECDCGERSFVRLGDLLRKDGRALKSCGCDRTPPRERSPVWMGCGEVSSKYYSTIKSRCKTKGIPLEVTIEDIADLYDKQRRTCALTGWEIQAGETASLDRIDSSKGYEKDNVQWVHKDINRFKSNFTLEEMYEMCKALIEHEP